MVTVYSTAAVSLLFILPLAVPPLSVLCVHTGYVVLFAIRVACIRFEQKSEVLSVRTSRLGFF